MEGVNAGNSYQPVGNGNSYYGNATSGQNYTENAFGINMKMVYVQGGSYNMGCTGEQGGDCDDNEKTVRYVTVSDFYIGQFEITQAQWQAVMGTSVYQQQSKAGESSIYGTGNDYPMYCVSWEEAKEFCRRLSQQTGKTYRLPTEAEWEYAARGGKKTQNTKYAGGYSLDYVGWYTSNSGGKTHAVGTKNANELGIYDMSGNVWEWCEDWYGDYSSGSQTNPAGPSSGSDRVLRGGGWNGSARSCRVSSRNYDSPGERFNFSGFRVVYLP
ncbi:MAG: formylglycine-generating enzyme family protein [Bacteroidales bacterium]|nr:formylglycine-generating enzyme family protein [Bacteroidales bacterium]